MNLVLLVLLKQFCMFFNLYFFFASLQKVLCLNLIYKKMSWFLTELYDNTMKSSEEEDLLSGATDETNF